VTDEERVELTAVLDDLVEEETDQQTDRGYASGRLLRAIARLNRLLTGPEADRSPADPGGH
jgi:hypothetical protein